MAEAALFSIATGILKNLATEIAKPGGSTILLLCSAKDELRSLEGTVKSIQAVLLDAEKQQWHEEQVKDWLGRLKDVLYDAQDLLDDVATEDLRRKVTPGNKMLKAVRVFFSKSNQLAHRLNVANKIRDLRKTLVEIENDSKLLKLERHPREETAAIGRGKKPERPSPDEKIIGREDDKKKIKLLLLNSSSNKSVSFVAIVGKGGLGKTALARLVYNDGEIGEHFELKMWVCVSDVFDVNSIVKDILKSANCQDLENKALDQLLNLLRETLSRKKYLLVLDDLWNEDREKWSKLGEWLEGGLRGSKILVTTRSHSVAEVTHAKSNIHRLRGLPEDESWNLFKKTAFEEGEESLDSEQEEIGRGLVKKCAGVPLAIRTIGGLLYSKKKDEWLRYKVHELPEIPEIDEADGGIMQVLKFSYDHIRSCLRHCFAYCSLFPKDHVYWKETMIHYWVAQGFIESRNGEDNLEEVADNYLSELLCRSFLDVEDKGDDGEVLTFKMHDLMHDLAQKVAGGECNIVNFNGGVSGEEIRHASFTTDTFSEEKMVSRLKTSKLRTFIFLGDKISTLNYRHKVLSQCRHCRVLDLGKTATPLPPSFFGKLKRLRFLNISCNDFIQSLPNSFTDLVNLQILTLYGCSSLKKFPGDLRKLVNLRHLSIESCRSLSHLPSLSELPSLRTLILVQLNALEFVQQTSDVGRSKTARPFFPSLERLEVHFCSKLEGWRGSRSFPKLRSVDVQGCPDLNLPPFPQVECLSIDGTKMLEQQLMANPNCPSEAAVGSTFNPFSKLKRLSLNDWLRRDDMEPSMLETPFRLASNLEYLRLSWVDLRSLSRGTRPLSLLQELNRSDLDLSCQEDEQGSLWQFLTKLRVLKISHLRNLVALPEGIQHVTALQSFEINYCPQLRSLPEWIGNFSLLEKFVLFHCESLERLPFEMRNLTHLKEIRIHNCPALKKEDWPHIAHIPVIVWED